jgi:broad specificity phosphatase PhoE
MIPKDANRRRIYLMRHGSVTYFDSDGRPLRPDTVPLNALGREQAQAAGRQFAAAGMRFDRVITSGLERTVQTAAGLLEQMQQLVEIEAIPALREIEGGKLADIPDDELRDAFLGALDGRGGPLEEKRFLGGESIGQLLDRVMPQIDRLRADADWDIVLLVLHGAVNRALLSYFLTGERQFFGRFAQSAGCINAIDVGEAKHDVTLRMVNQSPLDSLQTATRMTTMEALYQQYAKFRQKFGRNGTF